MSSKLTRLAVLASHPIQYFTPLYRLLAREPGLEVDVMFCRDFGVRERYDAQFGRAIRWDTDQLSGYAHRFLWNVSPVRNTFNPLHAINPGAFFRLLSGYDALWVNGYLYPSNWLAAVAARLRSTRLLLRSELRLDPARSEKPTDRVRNALVRGWVRRSDALLYIGHANREAYLAFGARPEQLFFSPYSVDVETLSAARQLMTTSARAAHWRALGVPDDRPIVLYVGKLTPRKHPEAMLRLAESEAGARAHFVVVGSGPLEAQLRAEVASRQLTNITFLGFANQSELPAVYAASDIFVMPSEQEPWGLVLNEAMAAGLVPVVAREVGAAADLITDGLTGYAFTAGDWQSMEAAVARVTGDDTLRARMARAAAERARGYSYRASVDGVLAALRAVCAMPEQAASSSSGAA